ncbi:MAG: molybdopterin-dependent oxidoreductase, partial [candidate division Zixibacteria bacterium]|nr:molybdopterin-dependent oxidoreductase [candidate division Zixibacteria bacterium]
GKFFPRKDGQAKIEGREEYVSDMVLPNMLFGKVVRSPYAHARIKRIDVSRAEKMGAVCLTYKDVPRVKYNERSGCLPSVCYKDRSVLTDTPRHVGEAVAAVAAESELEALRALELIEIEYEQLPAVFSPLEAMEPGSVSLWDTIQLGEKEIKIENNVAVARVIAEGDTDIGFNEADLIIEREFNTGRPYHCQMEIKSALCRPEPDGGITVWPTTQTLHNTRILLGEI